MFQNAGLGFKKIKLDIEDSEEDVLSKITSNVVEDGIPIGFPQLKNCGGFEVMSCQASSRDLHVLQTSLAATRRFEMADFRK